MNTRTDTTLRATSPEPGKDNTRNLLRILHIMYGLVPELFVLILFLSLSEAVMPFISILSMQLVIDGFTGGAAIGELIFIITVTIAANAALRLLSGILAKNREQAEVRLELAFQRKLCFHQMNFFLTDLESTRTKELQRDTRQAEMRGGGPRAIIKNFETGTGSILTLIISFFMLCRIFSHQEKTEVSSFWTSPLPVLFLIILVCAITVRTFKVQSAQSLKIAALNEEANHANGSAFAYMELISDYHFGKDIRIYGLSGFLCGYFDSLWKSSIGYALTLKLGKEKAKVPCITAISDGILNIPVYLLAIGKAYAREISVGNVVVYISSVQSFLQAIVKLVGFAGELPGHGRLITPWLALLDTEEERFFSGSAPLTGKSETFIPQNGLSKQTPEIVFTHVSFRYPNESRWALKDVSFALKGGEKTALVGENGSGKSTIVKLLCRFYEPEQGVITLNGRDIREYPLEEYRRLIGIVFQDFSLPAMRVGESVACTDVYEKSRVERSLGQAGLGDWMRTRGADTEAFLFKDYSGDGLEISGGEAQKLAIARAVCKDAPLLILDEPTAALDPRAEAEIYETFGRISQNKTCILISHRLSSCRFCHRILVMHSGRLVQTGSHEELLAQSGKYEELWNAQAEFYRPAPAP